MPYTRFQQLPLEVTQGALKASGIPGEPVICLQIYGRNTSVLRFRGKTNRTYVFEWDRKLTCHTLRVPASLWSMEKDAMARDLYNQALTLVVIPTIEIPVPVEPVNPEPKEEGRQEEEDAEETAPQPLDDNQKAQLEALKTHLADGTKIRASKYAEENGMTTDDVEVLVSSENSGLCIISGGWLKLDEPK